MPEMAVASGHASSVKTVAVQAFHGVNLSFEEDIVSCCAQGAGFDSTSRALALSVGRDTGHLSAQVSREPIQIGPGGGKRGGDIRTSGQFHHVNWLWRNLDQAWSPKETIVNSSGYKTVTSLVSNCNFEVNSQMANHTT